MYCSMYFNNILPVLELMLYHYIKQLPLSMLVQTLANTVQIAIKKYKQSTSKKTRQTREESPREPEERIREPEESVREPERQATRSN